MLSIPRKLSSMVLWGSPVNGLMKKVSGTFLFPARTRTHACTRKPCKGSRLGFSTSCRTEGRAIVIAILLTLLTTQGKFYPSHCPLLKNSRLLMLFKSEVVHTQDMFLCQHTLCSWRPSAYGHDQGCVILHRGGCELLSLSSHYLHLISSPWSSQEGGPC